MEGLSKEDISRRFQELVLKALYLWLIWQCIKVRMNGADYTGSEKSINGLSRYMFAQPELRNKDVKLIWFTFVR